ncbi:MAG TPA: hypothetical protein VFG68_10410 [Fimbriiglobus sp.]|nr:hypothetical protein [Fimbriiglobus sp.]
MTSALIVASVLAVHLSPPPIKLSQKDQAWAVGEFINRRSQVVNELLKTAAAMIDKPGRRGYAAVAIRKLAVLRASEATNFLVEHLTFGGLDELVGVEGPTGLDETWPCVHALARIGLPAFPALLAKVESTDAEITQLAAAYVFYRAMGREHALLYLSHKASQQTDRKKKKRLESLIEFVKTAKDVP